MLWRWRSAPGAGATRPALRTIAYGSALFLGCLVVAFLPQMLAWRSIYGSLIARSPVGPEIRWLHPHLADILWSARNGLFSTSPILYAAAIGLIAFAMARPAVGLPVLVAALRDDLLQCLYPGLVGQRRLRRAALRRHHSAALSRLRIVRRICRRHRPPPRAGGGSRGRGPLRGLESRADGRRPERHVPIWERRCRSTAPGPTRRRSSTAGSAIPSATRQAWSLRCATEFLPAHTICSRRTDSSAIPGSRTAASTSATMTTG